MGSIFMRFPGGKSKALTLSYDDGVRQDRRLIEIMKKNGLKGTFNISSGTGKSQNEIIDMLKAQGLDFTVKYENARSVDVKKMILDNSKIKQVYTEPLVSFEDGIKVYCDFLKNK